MKNGNGNNFLISIIVFVLAFILFRSMGCGSCTSVGCAGCAAGCASCAASCNDGCGTVINNGGTDATQAPVSFELSPKSEFYINDYSASLTEADKSAIVRSGEELEQSCGVQLIAVVINNSQYLSNDAIRQYANTIFNAWGVGDSTKNNGVLLLVNIAEGTYIGNAYCVEGTGLENLLPASDIGDIIDKNVLPHLDERQFASAVTEGYQALCSRISELYGD